MAKMFDRIVVELLPFDPKNTRNNLAGQGVDDIFREVRIYEDDKDVVSAKVYGLPVRFPAMVAKTDDDSESMTAAGDVGSTTLALTVDRRDLLQLGYLETTAGVPFKKGDKISKFIDWSGRTVQEFDDLYVVGVEMAGPHMYFEQVVLRCSSRNAI